MINDTEKKLRYYATQLEDHLLKSEQEIERLRASKKELRGSLISTMYIIEMLCDRLNIDTEQTVFGVNDEKTGEVLNQRPLADIMRDINAMLDEQEGK